MSTHATALTIMIVLWLAALVAVWRLMAAVERRWRRKARQRALAEELSRRVHDPDTARAWDQAQHRRPQ